MKHRIKEHTIFDNFLNEELTIVDLGACQGEFINSIEATIYPLLGTTTSVVVKPNGSTTSATNPAYTSTVLVSEWTPLNGAVGELATASVTWPVSGAITKTTA